MKDICDSDLILTRTGSGEPDLDINYKFADTLGIIGKELTALGGNLTQQAKDVRKTIKLYEEQAQESGKIQFIQEITNPELKEALTKLREPLPVKKIGDTVHWQVKTEIPLLYITDSEDEIEDAKKINPLCSAAQRKKSVYPGNPDTKFLSTKQNKNDAAQFKYNCDKCKKIFCSLQELRNHVANHEEEFYTCTKCFRTF